MAVAIQLLSAKSPNPNPGHGFMQFKTASFHSLMALRSPLSHRFEALIRTRVCRLSIDAPAVVTPRVLGLGIGFGFRSQEHRNLKKRAIVALAASHEESKHSDIDIEVEKENNGIKLGDKESEEAWKQTLDSFKEQALKMQNVSQEAYEIYSKKAMVILKETAEQLKIQADKARNDLGILAKELNEEGKEYLSAAAENSPEPVKEIVETFSSTDDLNEISQIRDFHLGIPYGSFLSIGGLLSFMLTGSISAIRFGIILGGALLALSVSSLRSYRRGEPYALPLTGQAVIAAMIFLREVRLLFQRASFFTFFPTIISGAMVAFYLYRIILHCSQSKGSDLGSGAEN